ncbi:HXXEE domain-containing protein [Nocardia alni]|uniref:HXXEE domain-containing protein n=1 Tax=Nocardia alni TaxID=2815723 RepID=UPI001C24A0E4|nr:HXXEE domain-containing protein [Nocardia alni]
MNKTELLNLYRKNWPRVAAVQAMALGGVSLLAGRKSQTNLRALSVMNAMTMCAHQYEEYVDPGYFPGMVNVGIFHSDQPKNYPFNAHSAMCANISFRALYVPPLLFPKVKWLGLPPVLLGIVQAFAHGALAPAMMHTRYSPGALTAALLHLPIGINYLSALRAQGPIDRSDWLKTLGVLAFFGAVGVALPNVRGADKESPYEFTDHQLGPFAASQPSDQKL